MRRQEAQSTRKTSLGSLDPIEKAVVAKFRANLFDHIADSTKHITWGIPLPYGARLWRYNGSLVSTDGTAPEPGAVATLRPDGRFGGAVAVEIGRTNIIVDGSFENGISDWGAYANGTVTRSSDYAYDGQYSLKYTASSTSTWGSGVRALIGGYAGKTLTLSWKIKAVGSAIGKRVYSNIYDPVSGSTQGTQITLDGTWQTITVTKTIDPAATYINVYFIGNFDAGDTVYADCCMCEEGSFPTSFVNGTRAPGYLVYDISHIDPRTGSYVWAGWVYPVDNPGWIGATIGQWSGTGDSIYHIIRGTGGKWSLICNYSGGSIPSNAPMRFNEWQHVGVVWDKPNGKSYLFVDGALVGQGTITGDISAYSWNGRMSVGSYYGDYQYQGTALYDELIVMPGTATPEQIAAWCAMGVPFWDPWVGQR